MSLSNSGSDRRDLALTQMDEYVAGISGDGRLPPETLDRYSDQGYTVGWQVSPKFSDGACRQLHILVNGDFPYTPPRIAVADGPETLAWPHLEEGGLLCVLPPNTSVSSRSPVSVTTRILGQACRLIEDTLRGSNVEDFRQEFLSYWGIAADGPLRFISTLEPTSQSRRIAVWCGRKVNVVGDSAAALRSWLNRWGADPGENRKYALRDGILVWLPKPPIPVEYPATPADVRELAKQHWPEVEEAFQDLVMPGVQEINLVLGARTAHGSCFFALVVSLPQHPSGSKHSCDPLVRGFRLGHIPKSLLVTRFFAGATKAAKCIVERADHSWIHGRDQDRRQSRLRRVRVAVLGCGSLGGSVARSLAQSGVGNLLLVDPETLDWPNIGRHALGAQSVLQPKAQALAREIEAAYPHLTGIRYSNKRFGMEHGSLLDELFECDLIVSTMGNWAAESFLNDCQQSTDGFPPIVYGWLEPHAAAAHVVVVPMYGACLRCGFDDKGRPNVTVTEWPAGGESLQEPACGAVYTPYGPAALCWAHALIAETTINALMSQPKGGHHYIWIGRRQRIVEGGGSWASTWVAQMGDPGCGGITVDRPWSQSASCPVCMPQINAA